MMLFVDSNVVVSSVIRDSVSRRFLLSGKHELLLPEYALEEIRRCIPGICKKTRLPEEDVEILLGVALSGLEIVPENAIKAKMGEAIGIIGKADSGDVPFIACALSVMADGIVTYDKHFRRQAKIPVYSPDEL